MALIEWDESLTLGISLFDIQHRRLVNILNMLYDASRRGQGSEILLSVFDQLADYTLTHFTAEEKFLAEYHVPELAAHQLGHAQLVERLAGLREKFQSGKTEMTDEVIKFLVSWLFSHIKVDDARYVPFLKAHGVR